MPVGSRKCGERLCVVFGCSKVSYRWNVVLTLPTSEDQIQHTPYHRYGHTAVTWDDRAYLFGGRNDRNGACNILYCFDPSSRCWSCPPVAGDLPGARDGHSACVVRDKMYIFGGYEEGGGKPARWRDFHSSTGIGNLMFVFGGRSDRAGPYHTNSEMYCHKLQIFDTVQQTWHEPQVHGEMPVGRRSHSAFSYNGELYILGGYNGLYDIHFDDMYKYNPAENRWSIVKAKGSGPCARRRQCCCIVDTRLFVFGGTRPCHSDNDEAEFNLIDLADLHVLDFSPSLKTLCMVTVLECSLDLSCLPRDIRWEIAAMTTNSNISRTLNTSG